MEQPTEKPDKANTLITIGLVMWLAGGVLFVCGCIGLVLIFGL